MSILKSLILEWTGKRAVKNRPAVREAVAAVLVWGDALYVMQRQRHLKAFPGYHAFPGGKVEKGDRDQVIDLPYLRSFPPQQMHALCRELQEELQFDLRAAIASGLVVNFSELGRATTPEFHRYRFRTHFYKIELSQPLDFTEDEHEVLEAAWVRPQALVEAYDHGRLLVVPPVYNIMKGLAEDIRRATLPDIAFHYDAAREVPCFEAMRDLWFAPVRSHTLPPTDRTNALIVGGFLVDPSPRDKGELRRLLHVLERFSLQGIFLTHHHGDHHQFADVLARQLSLGITLSRDAHTRIRAKRGERYFRDISVHFAKEGDVLTQWLGQEVRVWEVPGHDEGQLALAPAGLAWFLAGDLFQGVGTVVVAAPEGDMKKYFQSLEKVIDLAPNVIIPSHGMPMGSTFRLEETLQHRREREDQVWTLHRAGKSRQQMLDVIYQGLNRHLLPLARATIDSHLRKLDEEGRL